MIITARKSIPSTALFLYMTLDVIWL